MGSQTVGHDRATFTHSLTHTVYIVFMYGRYICYIYIVYIAYSKETAGIAERTLALGEKCVCWPFSTLTDTEPWGWCWGSPRECDRSSVWWPSSLSPDSTFPDTHWPCSALFSWLHFNCRHLFLQSCGGRTPSHLRNIRFLVQQVSGGAWMSFRSWGPERLMQEVMGHEGKHGQNHAGARFPASVGAGRQKKAPDWSAKSCWAEWTKEVRGGKDVNMVSASIVAILPKFPPNPGTAWIASVRIPHGGEGARSQGLSWFLELPQLAKAQSQIHSIFFVCVCIHLNSQGTFTYFI